MTAVILEFVVLRDNESSVDHILQRKVVKVSSIDSLNSPRYLELYWKDLLLMGIEGSLFITISDSIALETHYCYKRRGRDRLRIDEERE